MSEITKPIALDESLHTTEPTPRNLADVLSDELQNLATAISGGSDKVPKTDIATVEPTNTASRAYSVGELVYVNGNLYKVITAIASGATFTVGTNIQSTNVSGTVKDALDELTTIGENLLTQNLTINHQTDATLPIAEPLELNHLYVMSYNGIQGYNDSVLFMFSGGNTVSISCMSSIYTNSPMRFFLNRTSKGIYWSLLSGTTTSTITITSIRKII